MTQARKGSFGTRAVGLITAISAIASLGAWGCIQSSEDEQAKSAMNDASATPGQSEINHTTRQMCEAANECESNVCTRGACVPLSAMDGVKNGDETDVDCGGSVAPSCGVDLGCATGTDCESLSCGANICLAPAPNDGVKNGDETDTDCGGSNAPRCAVNAMCAANADCGSNVCGATGPYAGKCLVSPSCTGGAGAGNDCGKDKNESCCTTLAVPDMTNAGGQWQPGYNLDKYEVTTGRLRAFLKSVNGDVHANAPRQGAGEHPRFPGTGWRSQWNARLPGNPSLYGGDGWATVEFRLGPNGCKRGGGGSYGTTTWTTEPDQLDVEGGNFDTKAVVCIDWYLLNAFCIWDGGRLPTYAEFLTAFYGGAAPQSFPWGNAPTGGQQAWLQPGLTDEQKIASLDSAQLFDYMVTGMFNRAGYTYGDYTRYPGDRGTHVAPPGSKPRGAGAFGHMDLAGNVMELLLDSDPGAWNYPNIGNWKNITKPWPETTDCAYANPKPADCQKDWDDGGTRVMAGGSWEGHYGYGGAAGASPVGFTYHAIGGRCAR